ncbi:YraN family protein [Fulvitalea axinellae]
MAQRYGNRQHPDKRAVGNYGEDLALEHLNGSGYRCLERQYRHGRHEVDLIMRDGHTVVFVEVKARRDASFGYPEKSVGRDKREHIRKVAGGYLEKTGWEGNIRFDIVSVLFFPELKIDHFKDAF